MSLNRVVIDTNIFISALLNPEGTTRKIINLAVSQLQILQSEATYWELETRISKKKFDRYLEKSDRLDFLLTVKKKIKFINVTHQTEICPDPDDNKFLELAVSGNANYIVTGD